MGKFSEIDMAIEEIAHSCYKRGMDAGETYHAIEDEMSMYNIKASDHEDYVNEIIQDAKESIESTFNMIKGISQLGV
tara:strand:- start:285 stop:515 length:231 start_codon:yes stop_codon:yes gene_type:complete